MGERNIVGALKVSFRTQLESLNHTSFLHQEKSPLQMTMVEHEAHYIPICPFVLSSERFCSEARWRKEGYPSTEPPCGVAWSLLNALMLRITGAGPIALVKCMLGWKKHSSVTADSAWSRTWPRITVRNWWRGILWWWKEDTLTMLEHVFCHWGARTSFKRYGHDKYQWFSKVSDFYLIVNSTIMQDTSYFVSYCHYQFAMLSFQQK